MRIVQLSVSTDGSGDGSDASAEYKGYVLCWDRDFAAGAGAGINTVLTCASKYGPDVAIDDIAASKTEVRRYPLDAANLPGKAAGTDPIMPIPFWGNLTLTVDTGGATVTNAVVATIYIAEVP